MGKPAVLIFASGTTTDGGSGFANLVEATKTGELDADIVAVVSNNENGGVCQKAAQLHIPFVYFPGPYDAEHYKKIVSDAHAEWIVLSGWLRKIEGLDSRRTFNIHPALLSALGGRFGGHGMYGHHIHEAVKCALDAGEITESGFTMHFVTDEMDRGPIFFQHRVRLSKEMTADDIQAAVQSAEHLLQPKLTDMVVHEKICWDGRDPKSMRVASQS